MPPNGVNRFGHYLTTIMHISGAASEFGTARPIPVYFCGNRFATICIMADCFVCGMTKWRVDL